MRRRRLHHAPLPPDGGEVTLSAEASRHARVLRLAEGAPVVLFDGQGLEAEGELLSREEGEALRVRVGPPRRPPSTLAPVSLLVAPPKGERLERLVRMATEAGAARIVLLEAERSVVRWPAERVERKLERLRRVVREAARQSGRATLPELLPPRPLPEALGEAPPTAVRLALLPGSARSVYGLVASRPPSAGCWLVVGPEGGFTDAERERMLAAGWTAVGLGPHVLRVETAAVAAVALAVAALSDARAAAAGS